jgi:hypothetical protein
MGMMLTTTSPLRKQFQPTRASAAFKEHGDVAEWSKALAWKVSIRQKRIEGSNPSVSASLRLCKSAIFQQTIEIHENSGRVVRICPRQFVAIRFFMWG